MTQDPQFLVLAYYYFTSLSNPQQEVEKHKIFFKGRQITSRIYISTQGINGQMSGIQKDAEAYMEWMENREEFKNICFKIHTYHENVFPRQIVKVRNQLVALDEEVDLKKKGISVSPSKWLELIEKENKPLLLDVRNQYEWEVGRFEGSECPPCETFREFKAYAQELKTKVDPKKTPVMMCCTGGIRCELYSSLLLKEGFDEVYQLEGGIINYGLKQGNKHWLGKLFVFDDRLTVPISDEPAPVIGKCHQCETAIESYYNCANMDCNHLFLCCPVCLEQLKGCCSERCHQAPHVRPYCHQKAHKPFRKRHHYFKTK